MVQTSTHWQRESTLPHKQHIITLFNAGALCMENVNWYRAQGYAFIVRGGVLVDIVREA